MSPDSPAPRALHVSVADAAVTVITAEPVVRDWLTSYLGSWWTVRELPTTDGVPGAPVLRCSRDSAVYRSTHEQIHRQPHQVVEFARKPIQVASRSDGVYAIDPGEQVAYHTTCEAGQVDLIDRYPDFLGLARITPEQRNQMWARIGERVESLPHRGVLLNHDMVRSRQLLATLTDRSR